MSNRILSYRGLLADAGTETILLSTKKGEVGYRITKFELMPHEPGGTTYESVVKIFTQVQTTTPTATIDFSDTTLLAAGFMAGSDSHVYPVKDIIVFDQTIVNQDIDITHQNTGGTTDPMNYHLELEVIKLDESQAMVATLKDIRNNS